MSTPASAKQQPQQPQQSSVVNLSLSAACAKRKAEAKSEDDLVYRIASNGTELDCFDMRVLNAFYNDQPSAFGTYPLENADGGHWSGRDAVERLSLPQELRNEYVAWARNSGQTEVLNRIDFEMRQRAKTLTSARYTLSRHHTVAMGGLNENGSNGINATFNPGHSLVFDMSRDPQLRDEQLVVQANEQTTYDFSIDEGRERVEDNAYRLRVLSPLSNPLGCADQLALVIQRSVAFGRRLARTPPQIFATFSHMGTRIGFDTLNNADMFFVSFENLLMIDYESDATLTQAGQMPDDVCSNLRDRFCPMLDQIHTELPHQGPSEEEAQHPMRFLFFQTDSGGLHAFCTSHKHNPRNLVSLQIMCLLRGDFAYVCGTPVRGWSVRAGPKRLRYKHTGAYGGYTYKPDTLVAAVEYNEKTRKHEVKKMTDADHTFAWLNQPHPHDNPILLQGLATWNAFQVRIVDVLGGLSKRLELNESQSYDVLATLLKEHNPNIHDSVDQMIVSIQNQLFDSKKNKKSSSGSSNSSSSSKSDSSVLPPLSAVSSTRVLIKSIVTAFSDNLDTRKHEFLDSVQSQTADDARMYWDKFVASQDGAHMYVQLLRMLPRLYGHQTSGRYKMDTSLLETQFDMRFGTSNIGRDDFSTDDIDSSFANGAGIAWITPTPTQSSPSQQVAVAVVSMTFIVPIAQLVQKIVESMADTRASILPVAYMLHSDKGSHINAILINVHDRCVEHFESHGATNDGREELVQELVKQLNVALRTKDANAREFDLQTPSDICPAGILPTAAGSNSSSNSSSSQTNAFCMAYSLLYFHARFLFPDVPATKVLDWLLGPDGAVIRNTEQRLEFLQLYCAYVFEIVQNEQAKRAQSKIVDINKVNVANDKPVSVASANVSTPVANVKPSPPPPTAVASPPVKPAIAVVAASTKDKIEPAKTVTNAASSKDQTTKQPATVANAATSLKKKPWWSR
jgi:hypothetical protein